MSRNKKCISFLKIFWKWPTPSASETEGAAVNRTNGKKTQSCSGVAGVTAEIGRCLQGLKSKDTDRQRKFQRYSIWATIALYKIEQQYSFWSSRIKKMLPAKSKVLSLYNIPIKERFTGLNSIEHFIVSENSEGISR